MEIKFRYMDNDYVELSKFFYEERGLIKRGRITNTILLPLILLLILLIINFFVEFTLIPFLVWIIFTLVWVMLNKPIYNYKLTRDFKYAIKDDKLKGIDFKRETIITLTNRGIKKEIEGIETNIEWEAVEKVYILKKNIIIRLINASYINIPLRALKNKSDKEDFIQIINEYIKSDFGILD